MTQTKRPPANPGRFTNRHILDQIAQAGLLFQAWADEPWIVDGAAVRVSLVCFGQGGDNPQLDGRCVGRINADLSDAVSDLTLARPLSANANVAFQGIITRGPFDVAGHVARRWLQEPLNVNGRRNSDVLSPIVNGSDITDRTRDMWVIDFSGLSLEQAAQFCAPFEAIRNSALAARKKARDKEAIASWWSLWRPRPEYRAKRESLKRQIVTPRVSKHRLFVFERSSVTPDDAVVAIARDDDTTFGILHSRFHEAWALRLGTSLEDRPRYTPTTTFETFPFPAGLTPSIPAARYADDPRARRIAAAAKRLDDLRNAWLNPPDLIEIVPEVVPGYPDRILPKTAEAAVTLKSRTLTNLYNQRPQWLADAHEALDRAVAAAYGWPEDISTEDALARLLALNLERAAAQA